MPLTFTPIQKIPIIQPGDNLADIILTSIQDSHLTLEDNDILVLAQKIVSKAESRHVNLTSIKPSEKAIELAKISEKDPRLAELILRESNEVLRIRPGTVIVEHRLGFICANAGIDHSNVNIPGSVSTDADSEDWVLLLPADPDRSALEDSAQIEIANQSPHGRDDH